MMNTSTKIQGIQLKRISIKNDLVHVSRFDSICHRSDIKKTSDLELTKEGYFEKGTPIKWDIDGPSLTLDKLWSFFEWLHDSQIGEISMGFNAVSDEKVWDLDIYSSVSIDFERTKNHAEDLANVLIFIVKESQVTSEQANKVLEK